MMAPHLEVLALPTTHRFQRGDDLAAELLRAADIAGITLLDGDVVCVASKVVSLVEGQQVALPPASDTEDPRQGRRQLAREHATAIVADAPWVLVTRTHHGFVAANGGVDASNLAEGEALLLPDDPDASAAHLHERLAERTGARIGVIISDTFGRPWRMGQTDVALGVAGTAAIRDERGGTDLDGRPLEVTEAAIADEVAAAADLVRTKSSGTPFVVVRGLPSDDPGTGADLIRPLAEDLFATGGPTAVDHGVRARRTIRRFDPDRPVPTDLLERAVTAAATAPAPHHTQPWRFVRLRDRTRTRLLDVMAERWRADLRRDGESPETIDRRIAASDAILRTAPTLLAPFVVLDGAHSYPDPRRTDAERDMFLLSGGAALANLQVVLTAYGLGAAWISSTLFCAPTVREALDLDASWQPLGLIAVGWPAVAPQPRGERSVTDLLIDR